MSSAGAPDVSQAVMGDILFYLNSFDKPLRKRIKLAIRLNGHVYNLRCIAEFRRSMFLGLPSVTTKQLILTVQYAPKQRPLSFRYVSPIGKPPYLLRQTSHPLLISHFRGCCIKNLAALFPHRHSHTQHLLLLLLLPQEHSQQQRLSFFSTACAQQKQPQPAPEQLQREREVSLPSLRAASSSSSSVGLCARAIEAQMEEEESRCSVCVYFALSYWGL